LTGGSGRQPIGELDENPNMRLGESPRGIDVDEQRWLQPAVRPLVGVVSELVV
jgi:hypothetical protein